MTNTELKALSPARISFITRAGTNGGDAWRNQRSKLTHLIAIEDFDGARALLDEITLRENKQRRGMRTDWMREPEPVNAWKMLGDALRADPPRKFDHSK